MYRFLVILICFLLVYLQDLWPDTETLQGIVEKSVLPSMFKEAYANIQTTGTSSWQQLEVPKMKLYPWSSDSTYIHNPPFFQTMKLNPDRVKNVERA